MPDEEIVVLKNVRARIKDLVWPIVVEAPLRCAMLALSVVARHSARFRKPD